MSQIIKVLAMEVLDSRGNPTVQTEVWTEFGYGKAIVPSGASTGDLEAWELRDHDPLAYLGKGVSKAVDNVNNIIAPAIIGLEATEQRALDAQLIALDGTENKNKLGANAILSVSLAVAKAAADELELELYRYLGGVNAHQMPIPMVNIINGGSHANNSIEFQEFMIVPVGAKNIKTAIRMAAEVFHHLKQVLSKQGHVCAVGDEGGFAPNLANGEEALDLITEAIIKAGYKPSIDFKIALDCAASAFYDKLTETYIFKKESALSGVMITKTTDQLIAYYMQLIDKYEIISIEDGFSEYDWAGFTKFTNLVGDYCQVVGDDIFVTNPKILKKGITSKAANAILIKLNQIGTLTETIDTIEMAHKAGWKTIISHRSGETEDTTIADLAVAYNTGQIKTGSMSRTDRIAKYNRLLKIEQILNNTAIYSACQSFSYICKGKKK